MCGLSVVSNSAFSNNRIHLPSFRVSLGPNSVESNGDSYNASITDDGRYAAFHSNATNLAPNDPYFYDIFLRKLTFGTTKILSIGLNGYPAGGNSYCPIISSNGSNVLFYSTASDLVPNDTNGAADIFIYNLANDLISRVNLSSSGQQANSLSEIGGISADGRIVAFASFATNLVDNDVNSKEDIFIRDLQSGTTTLVSKNSDGTLGNGSSYIAQISGNGRYVSFMSNSSNLVNGDTNNTFDIFVHDVMISQTKRVSVSSSGQQANDQSDSNGISFDGRYITFQSSASNLVSGDTGGYSDIFRHDQLTGTTTRVSVNSNGVQGNANSTGAAGSYGGISNIDATGRYVVFTSDANNLDDGDTNNLRDVFVRDMTTATTVRVSLGLEGVESNNNSTYTFISPNGQYILYHSLASNLVPNDNNNKSDVFKVNNPFKIYNYVGLTVAANSMQEGASSEIVLNRTGDLSGPLNVDLGISGTAVSGVDYEVIPGQIVIPAGQESMSIPVRIIDDNIVEDPKNIHVTLLSSQNYILGGAKEIDMSVIDDDNYIVNLEVMESIAVEGGAPVKVKISRLGGSNKQITIPLVIGGSASSGVDYQAIPQSINMPVGVEEVVIDIAAFSDQISEGVETVNIGISRGQGFVPGQSTQGTVLVLDNDVTRVSISVSKGRTKESVFAPDAGRITINRTGPTVLSLLVNLQISGTASNGMDYRTIPQAVTIPAGQNMFELLVTSIDDQVSEPDENVIVQLAAGTGYAIDKQKDTGKVIIADNDIPLINTSVVRSWASEQTGDAAKILINRIGDLDPALQINIVKAGTAVNGVNYRAVGDMITVPAMTGSVSVEIVPLDNQQIEGNRSVVIGIVAGAGYNIGAPNTSKVVIKDAISRVNKSSAGLQAGKGGFSPVLNGDGSRILFISSAGNLVVGDANGIEDVFIVDPLTGFIDLISRGASGEANGRSFYPSLTPGNTFAAFASDASNLVLNDTNNLTDVFVRNLGTGTISRASVSGDGAEGNRPSMNPSLSDDGRYVVFESYASNLVAGDAGVNKNIYLRDMSLGTTVKISSGLSGAAANGDSFLPKISGDGRFIAYVSGASNIVADDNNLSSDVFVFDRNTGTTSLASVSMDGFVGDNASSSPVMSSDGRYVAFESLASNFVSNDKNNSKDVFVRDMQSAMTQRISVGTGSKEGNWASFKPAISSDGRFVAYISQASNLSEDDTNCGSDAFVFDVQRGKTERLSLPRKRNTECSTVSDISVSGDGRLVGFQSFGAHYVMSDTNKVEDIFYTANPLLGEQPYGIHSYPKRSE